MNLKKLIKIRINLFDILKMESAIISSKKTTMVDGNSETETDAFTMQRRKNKGVEDVQREIKVLCWTMSLPDNHVDKHFFREGQQCNNCSSCSDEFHFLHYTSDTNAYCVKCYLDRFCDVIDEEQFFCVIIKRTNRVLIEIINS